MQDELKDMKQTNYQIECELREEEARAEVVREELMQAAQVTMFLSQQKRIWTSLYILWTVFITVLFKSSQ